MGASEIDNSRSYRADYACSLILIKTIILFLYEPKDEEEELPMSPVSKKAEELSNDALSDAMRNLRFVSRQVGT